MKNSIRNIGKCWGLFVGIILALAGWGIKEYVAENFYYAYAGTNVHAAFTDMLWFAEVHHEYLPNVHLDQYSSAWCALTQIVVITVIYALMQFVSKITVNTKIISILSCLIGVDVCLGIYAFTGNIENVFDSIILMSAITFMYNIGIFNQNNSVLVSMFVFGSLGNFIEGNVREFVIDYLWLLPKYSDQVHNLEDMMIWIGLLGCVVLFGIWLAKGMISIIRKFQNLKNVEMIAEARV